MMEDDEILRLRARKISGRKMELKQFQDESISVLEFVLSSERYAIENKFVTEVFLLRDLTTVPGAPSFFAGICNFRGKIITLLNLKVLFNMQNYGITELNKVVVIHFNQVEFGILTDSIVGTFFLKKDSFGNATAGNDIPNSGFISGISETGLILIDGKELITSKSIIVNHK
jgi:purine-binding chemotaxis protein CheW